MIYIVCDGIVLHLCSENPRSLTSPQKSIKFGTTSNFSFQFFPAQNIEQILHLDSTQTFPVKTHLCAPANKISSLDHAGNAKSFGWRKNKV